MYNITVAFAEYERDFNRERTIAGLDAAKDRGVKLGRIPKSHTTDMRIKI